VNATADAQKAERLPLRKLVKGAPKCYRPHPDCWPEILSVRLECSSCHSDDQEYMCMGHWRAMAEQVAWSGTSDADECGTCGGAPWDLIVEWPNGRVVTLHIAPAKK
jgi:hypothetical protein